MGVEDCSQDAFVLPSQTLQRTPISSQVKPLDDLNLLSQSSSDTPMTPEKSFSTLSPGREKGTALERNEIELLSRRRFDDSEFGKAENESRLKHFNKDCDDSDFLAKHNENHLRDITKRLRYPVKPADHNKHVLERYRTHREEVSSVILSYFFQISQGPTYVCSCCGCLHFRKAVVVQKR